VKWTFDELYFLSLLLLFFLLLSSIIISYVPFMAVIWWIKVYMYSVTDPAWLIAKQVNKQTCQVTATNWHRTDFRDLYKTLSAGVTHSPDAILTQWAKRRQLHTCEKQTTHINTQKNIDLTWFLAISGCKRVNYNEMDGDRLRLHANRNCYRLSRV